MPTTAPDMSDLARDYLPLARSLARRFARGQFLWLRDDFTSDALAALWRAAGSYDPARGLAFATWARWAIRNALLKRLRIERAKNRAAFRVVPPAVQDDGRAVDAVALVPDDAPRGEEVAARNEYVAKLLTALPSADREAVRRHVMNGESLVALGAEGGVTASRIGQRVQRGLRRLKELHGAAL